MFQMMIGQVDKCEEHFIGTHFISFIVPLFPTHSMYVTHEEVSHEHGAAALSWEGVDLPIYWKSALLGYLRVWLFALTVMSPLYLMWGDAFDFKRPEWLVSLAFFIPWIFTFFMGRLSADEKKKRIIWGNITGLMLDPSCLAPFEREDSCFTMMEELKVMGYSTQEPDLFAKEILDENNSQDPEFDLGLLNLAYTYACYQAVSDKEWQPISEQLWKAFPTD